MFSNPVDSRQLIHLPVWMKYLIIVLLLVSFGLSGYLAFSYLGEPGSSDIIILAMSGLQFAATALVAVILLLFSQTESTIGTLEERANRFLDLQLPRFLSRMTSPGLSGSVLTVHVSERVDLFGRRYTILDNGTEVMRLWCGINVRRLILIVFLKCPGARDRDEAVGRVRDMLRFTLGGAETLGYKHNIEPIGGLDDSVSLWTSVQLGDGFLTDPALKYSWGQDVAMMMQSLLRTANRSGGLIVLHPDLQPAPL